METASGKGGWIALGPLLACTVAALVWPLAVLSIPSAVLAGTAGLVRHAERRAERWLPSRGSLKPLPGYRPALVVFGAQTTAEGPSAELAARLDHALLLWHRGAAPQILVSGGLDGTLDEVASMSAYLRERGVPNQAVMPCRPGGNTRQTIRAVARQATEARLGPFVAVSTPYHACRIANEALRQGLEMRVSAPADTPEMRYRPIYRVRFVSEVLGVLWYALPDPWARRVTAAIPVWRHCLPLVLAGQLPLSSLWTGGATNEDGNRP